MFISYSQNFEDVMLWRALKHLEQGFYIDVGAYDPNMDSVTRVFYDKGWRGINIEPQKNFWNQFCKERPRDINLCVAVGNAKENKTFYEVVDTGLSTFDSAIAETHQKKGYGVNQEQVEVITLNDICLQYVNSDIHFLKIDVEGFEKQALEGMNFNRFRPWIIVVESTYPSTEMKTDEKWDYLILSYDYEFVYFDGLNCFYIAKERSELKQCFATPPNVFDRVRTIEFVELLQKTMEQKHTIDKANACIESLKTELNGIYNGLSWRITQPLRWLKRSITKI